MQITKYISIYPREVFPGTGKHEPIPRPMCWTFVCSGQNVGSGWISWPQQAPGGEWQLGAMAIVWVRVAGFLSPLKWIASKTNASETNISYLDNCPSKVDILKELGLG